MKIFSTVFKLKSGHNFRIKQISIRKNQRGIIPQKHVGGVTVLFLCTLSDGDLYLYKVS